MVKCHPRLKDIFVQFQIPNAIVVLVEYSVLAVLTLAVNLLEYVAPHPHHHLPDVLINWVIRVVIRAMMVQILEFVNAVVQVLVDHASTSQRRLIRHWDGKQLILGRGK
ncbi:MAG TPA: hypothetical protein VIO11_01955, partial [Candidatus Methanoperedens sp.]